MRVGLFIPCYIDQLYPRVGIATLRLLEHFHAGRIEFPPSQICCGQPMANSGCMADARPAAERFVATFRDYDYVVAPSGSCVAMVRHHYHGLVSDAASLAKLQAKTFELCEFLTDVLQVEPPTGHFPRRVGLHQSCHGLRELRLGSDSELNIPPFNKSERLLSRLDGIEFATLERPDECCGFGGSFAVYEEGVSCMMGRDRIADHLRAEAEVLTAGDMSCLMHLDGLIRRDRRPLRVLHIAELLAEALGLTISD